ncbi:hypothetical protein [Kiloniella majae]|uniref:hypothetical protein n=1 Tax=Kiloniella majae TaxID=1938558 RepID=UPI000A276E4C|nr:hypothetical protein [Kiloniella majae]
MKYIPPIGKTGDAPYVDGDPDLAIEGDAVSARAWEHPMREIDNVIKLTGLTPSEADLTQLNQALDLKIAAASSLSPYDIPFNAGFDGDLVAEDLEVKTYSTMIIAREITPIDVIAKLETAPVGSGVVFDLTADGVSIFDALPSFAVDTGNYLPGTLKANVKIAKGAVLNFAVTGVGSTTAGAGLRIGLDGRS